MEPKTGKATQIGEAIKIAPQTRSYHIVNAAGVIARDCPPAALSSLQMLHQAGQEGAMHVDNADIVLVLIKI